MLHQVNPWFWRRRSSTIAEKPGALQAGERLRPVTDATSVRIRNGKSEVLNGPFADTQEQLGGYYVIDVQRDAL